MAERPKSTDECAERYGALSFDEVQGIVWPDAQKWLLPWSVPLSISMRLPGISQRVRRIFCNKEVHEPLTAVFSDLMGKNLHTELKTFDGCFNPRWVRGVPGHPSTHSWGLAFDFNALDNPLGGASKWTPAFIECWEAGGFVWGGRFQRRDPMHFQWVGI